jgi:dTDP-4-dehydrorhamnose 3,5-epimerase
MRIVPGAFEGVFLLDIEPREDDRGFLARTFSTDELAAFGMKTQLAQAQIAFTPRPGTVRGLYYQRPPARSATRPGADFDRGPQGRLRSWGGDTRIVRCTRGRVFDVLVDLRPDSRTFKRWDGIELDESSRRSIYIPPGFAHGYQTLTEGAELLYLLGGPQPPEPPTGIRHDDPDLAISWPNPITFVSPRDLEFPLFEAS